MPLKLKLKVKQEPQVKAEPAAPRIKIRRPTTPEPAREKPKKLKLSLGRAAAPALEPPKRVPKVRVKPTRIPGEGYDSEAPDVEDDPLLEQAIVIRFANDANLDFVHTAVDTGDLSNVNIKWITRDKAVVNVNSLLYLARLIDMPTVTELYKTIDKKNIFKTIDVSQVLLVLRRINPKQLNMDTDFEVPELATYIHPWYTLTVNNEIRPQKTVYRHGLLPAFEDVFRRFRPQKTNHRLMVDIEARVDEIVRRDTEAQEAHYEYVDPRAQPKPSESARTYVPENIDGALLGEPDDEQTALDLEADLDNALEQELTDALDGTLNTAAATVLMKSEYNDDEMDDEDDEENDEDEDEDDDEDDDEDEADKEDKSRVKKLEDEIADIQRAAEKQKTLLAAASYKMMRMKFQLAYNNLKSQLDNKRRELVKLREQQQKQHQPETKPPPVQNNNDNEEEDEDEEEEEENDNDNGENDDNDDNDSDNNRQDNANALPQNEATGEQKWPAQEQSAEEEDFDEFQGLF